MCSIVWASVRLPIDELAQLRKQFAAKFGREFVEDALYNRNDCVSFSLVEKLSSVVPSRTSIYEYLKELCPEGITLDDEWVDDPVLELELSGASDELKSTYDQKVSSNHLIHLNPLTALSS